MSRLVLGNACAALAHFAQALGAPFEALPAAQDDDALAAWRERAAGGAPSPSILVAVWAEAPAPKALLELGEAEWQARAEAPLLAWNLALGAASRRCADGGAIVAVVEGPAALDAAGWVPEAGLADAVAALVRSVAQAEGARGVRANTVLTPARIGAAAGARGAGLSPGFPGTLEREALGAARWLLSDASAGVTGHTLAADFGRSW